MKIIRHRQRHTEFRYYRLFLWNDDSSAGFMFDCDENGNLSPGVANMQSYQECIGGKIAVHDCGIKSYERSWVDPAVGLCDCGEKVVLSHFTNTCSCGTDYDSSGMALAPREFWGEETGESVSDILAADIE